MPISKIKTEYGAQLALSVDIKVYEFLVIQKLKKEVEQNEFDALVVFVYNCGVSSTLFKMVNSKNPLLREWWATHYITGQGNPKPLKGLIERRKAEAKLFFHI